MSRFLILCKYESESDKSKKWLLELRCANFQIFLIHIIGLHTTLLAFKIIYDVTVIEVIDSIASSQIQTSVEEIAKWLTDSHMNMNTLKTKEMIIDFH